MNTKSCFVILRDTVRALWPRHFPQILPPHRPATRTAANFNASPNRLLTLWAALFIAAYSLPASAVITVTLYDTPYNNTSDGGGEFAAVSNFDFLQFYGASATYDPPGATPVGFGTFCLEYREEISYGVTYYAVLNPGAVSGGSTGNGLSPIVNGMDRISKGTAWLYSQYAAGALAGYNYSSTTARQQSSRYLQYAIWYLEGEVTLSNNDRNANPFLTAVRNKFGSYTAAAANADLVTYGSVVGVEYGVIALNLYTGYDPLTGTYTGKAQDQLAIIPEPATIVAAAMLLLPFCVGVIRSWRKGRSWNWRHSAR